MYATCLFCHADLGRNDVVEALPVGRRVAFDAERGRLWIVCRRCARWNLTPFEERWDALEQCERAFERTRLRVSTDNIGLARVSEGLELVRIGRALRPELAAWRYGDQFGRRRRRQLAMTGAAVLGVGAVAVGGPVAGLYTFGSLQGLSVLLQFGMQYGEWKRVVTRVPVPTAEGRRVVALAPINARQARIRATDSGWELELFYRSGEPLHREMLAGVQRRTPSTILTGEDAIRAAGRVLPYLNAYGGSRAAVAAAVRVVEAAGDAGGCFSAAARLPGYLPSRSLLEGMGLSSRRTTIHGVLAALPRDVRLAMEMTAHEESERRALEGELGELEREWREAEEIAAIADDLLPNPGVAAAVERLRQQPR